VRAWPSWAQRHIVLGLDLQGGSSLLLEVDTAAVRKERLQGVADDVLRILRQNRIPFTGRAIHGNSVEVRITRESDVDNAVAKLRELAQPLSGILGTSGQRSVDIAENGGLITLTPSDAAINERIRQAVDQSIQIIERRVNELGLVEPTIQREGASRILVQVPGLQDPSRLKDILGKTAKLDFRMVDLSMTPEHATATHVPQDSEILDGESGQKNLIEKRVLVSGADLVDAQPGFDQRSNEPIVSFRFNSSGARKFAEATQQNVGKPFAIVLDNKVISAPVIREPILGGSGQISGNFTVQSANDLAILLRAGALPAPLTVIEERTVGPGLGQDSINAGEHAASVGAALVGFFMLVN
jgi:preprotein translocase subunit SecD